MADVLIVDDEENLTYSIKVTLTREGHDCRTAVTVAAGLEECCRKLPDLALVDVHLPDGSGLDLLTHIHEKAPDIPVIVITSFGTVESAVAAMQRGAANYVQKPLRLGELKLTVARSLENTEIRKDLDAYRQMTHRESESVAIVGECPQLREILATASKFASVSPGPDGVVVTTLLLGETGTGKEVLARYIHHQSDQSDRPFVHVSCTAIPESLFEAELFGYERGTFTDAKAEKKGLLEVANGGALFLDEIGDMPLETQSKLLVAIETGRFRRLGGTSERVSHVRIIAATNCDLEQKISDGAFRPDLFFRLKGFCLELPPLRERGEDVFLLTDFFLDRFCRKFHKAIPRLLPDAYSAIRKYHWPGNVRELANVLQRAVLLNDSDLLTSSALGLDGTTTPVPSSQDGEIHFEFSKGQYTLASVEKQLLAQALADSGGNISKAARLIGLSRGGFRYRMQKLGLDTEQPPS